MERRVSREKTLANSLANGPIIASTGQEDARRASSNACIRFPDDGDRLRFVESCANQGSPGRK